MKNTLFFEDRQFVLLENKNTGDNQIILDITAGATSETWTVQYGSTTNSYTVAAGQSQTITLPTNLANVSLTFYATTGVNYSIVFPAANNGDLIVNESTETRTFNVCYKCGTMQVIDNLTSTSKTDALSANQGRVLKSLLGTIDQSKEGSFTIGKYVIQWGTIADDKFARVSNNMVHATAAFSVKMANTNYFAVVQPTFSINATAYDECTGAPASLGQTSLEFRVFANGVFTTTNLANYGMSGRWLVIGLKA